MRCVSHTILGRRPAQKVMTAHEQQPERILHHETRASMRVCCDITHLLLNNPERLTWANVTAFPLTPMSLHESFLTRSCPPLQSDMGPNRTQVPEEELLRQAVTAQGKWEQEVMSTLTSPAVSVRKKKIGLVLLIGCETKNRLPLLLTSSSIGVSSREASVLGGLRRAELVSAL